MRGTMQLILNEALLLGAGALALAMVLSFFLGLERHFHLEDTDVKTHVLVGVGSCLFTLTSTYGFVVPGTSTLTLGPLHLATQIVSGIGFLSTGIIFVNNGIIEGLIAAVTVWLSAIIGVACGTGLGILAAITFVLHFLLISAIGFFVERISSSHRNNRAVIKHEPTKGVMKKILVAASEHRYIASVKSTESIQTENGVGMHVALRLEGPYPQDALMKELTQIEDITAVDRVERMEFD